MDGQYLNTTDVARRLDTNPASVRNFATQLNELGYPLKKGEGSEWLWPIDLVEVVRVAYQISNPVSSVKKQPRITFKDSVLLLEATGRLANGAKRSESLPEVLADLRGLPDRVFAEVSRLSDEVDRLNKSITDFAKSDTGLEGRVQASLRPLENAASHLWEVTRRAEREITNVAMGGWVPTFGFLLLAGSWVAYLLIGLLPEIVVNPLRILWPYATVFVTGGVLGWWFGRP